MRAAVYDEFGGADHLEVREVDAPPVGPDTVLVRVHATSVNPVDWKIREGYLKGAYPHHLPIIPGWDVAGVVEAVGPAVRTGLKVGDEVFGYVRRDDVAFGASAELIPAPERTVTRKPASLSFEEAGSLPLVGLTAWQSLTEALEIREGERVLVHAAAGGVGQLLVQLVKAKGGRVVATAGSADKLAIASRLGADATINYSEVDDLASEVRKANGGKGVDVAYDGAGRSTFDASLASLRPRGMMVLFGGASGQVPPFDLQRLNTGGSLFVTRPTLGSYIATREELLERGTSVLGDIAAGRLAVDIGGRYPLDEAATAYDDLEGRRTTGKLLLVP